MQVDVKATVWLTSPDGGDLSKHYEVSQGWVYEGKSGERDWMEHHAPDMRSQGWFRVAQLTLPITRPSREEVIPAAVAALREKQRENRVKAEEENQQIEQAINNLLSLSFEGGVVEVKTATIDEPFDNPHHGHKDADWEGDDDSPF